MKGEKNPTWFHTRRLEEPTLQAGQEGGLNRLWDKLGKVETKPLNLGSTPPPLNYVTAPVPSQFQGIAKWPPPNTWQAEDGGWAEF